MNKFDCSPVNRRTIWQRHLQNAQRNNADPALDSIMYDFVIDLALETAIARYFVRSDLKQLWDFNI